MNPKLCPLCDSALVEVSINIETNPRYGIPSGMLLGFAAGNPELRGVCARGCKIVVQASQPLPKAGE